MGSYAALNDIIKRDLQSARVHSILERVGVDREHGWVGITAFQFSNERSLCWNATCTDNYADTNIYSSAVSLRYAAREATERNYRKYEALGANFRFEPVAVETAGVVGTESPQQRLYLRSVDVS